MSEFVKLPDGKMVCFNPGGRWHGWLFTLHPDGNLVSECQLGFHVPKADPVWKKLHEAGRTKAGNDISGI